MAVRRVAAGPRRWLADRWRRPAFRLGMLAVAVPAVLFGVPALFGVPVLVGDNLIQNFPLRTLVGRDLVHGHLPLWDPYVWSGAPLLAGFNAGAAYPVSWLFAVLPHLLAWVANQVVVEVVAASGMFVFLRLQGRTRLAAALAAACFAYGGFVAMQSVHLDLVEAAGWLVWAFVALDRLARRPAGRPAAPWIALLGAALGLMALTGAAEPLLDGGVALVLYTLWLALRGPGRRLVVLGGAVGGAALGALIGAAQLLPGEALQSTSQRGLHTFAYFSSGSMNKSLTLLGLDPLLLGGSHKVPLSYVGTYNLPEISSYVGILAVMGAVGLLARRHRRHPEAANWWIWYVVIAVGLLLAWGSFTPLAHLEYLVPLYNRQRLLVRNLLEVDLAMCVLFAAWLDHMLLAPGPEPDPRTKLSRRWPVLRSDVVLPLLPVVAVVGLQIVMVAGGPWFPHFLHVPGPVSYGTLWKQDVFLTVPSAVAVGAGLLVLRRRQLAPRLGRLLVVVVAADLLVFNGFAQVDPQLHTAVSGAEPAANALAAAVAAAPRGADGETPRTAVFDPDRFYPNEVDQLGQPDLNVLRSLDSVQGYGAVVSGAYDAATGTHLQSNLAEGALENGTFDTLDLGVLVTPPENFLHMVAAPADAPKGIIEGATPYPPGPPDPGASPLTAGAPPTPPTAYQFLLPPAATVPLGPGTTRTFFFGTVLAVTKLTVPLAKAVAPVGPNPRVRLGLLGPAGTVVHWLEGPDGVPVRGRMQLAVPRPMQSAGLVVQQLPPAGLPAEATVSLGAPVLDTAGQGTYRVDGGFRDVVTAPAWHFAGAIGPFGVFERTTLKGRTWLTGAGTTKVLEDEPWGTEAVSVRAPAPTMLVRSTAFATGWQA
ncbi:MAG TPA: hypothetical protein VE991_08310, partial [Acidimicrobiales bacterium]|nr:hypothetical protein [Acidimicrobiales bacterium]